MFKREINELAYMDGTDTAKLMRKLQINVVIWRSLFVLAILSHLIW